MSDYETRLRRIHKASESLTDGDGRPICAECEQTHPCDDVQLLDLLSEERTKWEQAEAEVLDTRAALQTATDYAGLMDQRIQTLEAALRDIATSDSVGICDSGYSVAAVAHDALAAQEPKP
jgi:hypothetical protein